MPCNRYQIDKSKSLYIYSSATQSLMHIEMPVSHSFVGKTMLNCYWKAYYSNRAKILWVPKLNWFWYSAQYTRYNYIFQNRTHFLLTDINTWLGSLQSDLFIVYRQYDIVFRSHRCRFYNSRQVCRLKKAIATRDCIRNIRETLSEKIPCYLQYPIRTKYSNIFE